MRKNKKCVLAGYFGVLILCFVFVMSLSGHVSAEDNIVPTSVIVEPLDGTSITGTTYTIYGTTSGEEDADIQKVEVSTDNGVTWNVAEGTTTWSYNGTSPPDGVYIVLSGATDAVGNVEIPGEGITVQFDTSAQ